MSYEIERKFLVDQSKLCLPSEGSFIIQGYLSDNDRNVIRVRIKDNHAYMTIKSAETDIVRTEFEYAIDSDNAMYMLNNMCLYPLVKKIRYLVYYGEHWWEIDVFDADNTGLILAEIELKSKNEKFMHPEWLSDEVTNHVQFYNCNLAKNPFSKWKVNTHHSS